MIRLLLDQNISPKSTTFLRELGWEVSDVRELGKAGATDEEIYQIAVKGKWVFVTFDLDFSRRCMADQALEGLILLRVQPQTIHNLHTALNDFFARIEPAQFEGPIVTLDNHSYRIKNFKHAQT